MSDRDKDRGHRDTLDFDIASTGVIERGVLVDERYRVLSYLGDGGMGVVYEAEDEHLEERVALKLLHGHLAHDKKFRAQLRREVRLARRVSHPNVCRVHDLGRHEDALFITMELIRGESLRQLLKEGETPQLAKKIDILIQLCSALAAAHRAGVLHRDVKPDNVLVAGDRAVLTDFGVAALVDGAHGRAFVGTPPYMAPEIMLGASPDTRVDVYSTAVLAFELLGGELPFPIKSVADCLAHAESRPVVPPLHRGAAPTAIREALDSVLASALASEPGRRPRDIDKLAEGLSRASRGEAASPHRIARGTTSLRPETDSGSTRARVATALLFVPESPDLDDEILERVVSDWGGYLFECDETGVHAVFGAPVARGDDAVRAAQAGLDMIERFGGEAAMDTRRLSFQLAHDGTLLGLEKAFDELEALMGRPGELGCSAASARHVAGHFRAEPRGKDHNGRSRFAVMSLGSDADAAAPPLVGREQELEVLETALRVAFEERTPVLVQIVGAAGIGKTRLHQELSRRLASRREIDWLIGHGAPVAEAAPLLVLRSADPQWYEAVLRAGVGDHRNAAAAARSWLLKRATRRPVVLIIEDAHWADEASLEFISDLARSMGSAPIAVLVVARSPAIDSVRTIEVSALGQGEAAHLAKRLAPGLEARVVTDIVQRADGNPLFVSELVRHVSDTSPEAQAVPVTVEAAIQGWTDRLVGRSRAILEAASVIGPEFSLDLLRALLEGVESPTDILEAELTGLVAAGVLVASEVAGEPESESYRFASPLVRDVVYAQLDPEARHELHRMIATRLEASPRRPGGNAVLGHHWLAANDKEKARLAYRQAGREALDLFAYGEATVALEHAERLTPVASRDPELLELVGDAFIQRDATAARERYQAALAARDEDDAEARASLSEKLAVTSSALADHLDAVRHLESGLAIAELGGSVSKKTKARLLAQLGWVLGYKLGDNERGLPYSEEAVALLEGTGDKPALARALGRLGGNYMRAGRWRDQLECNRRNLQLARELGDVRSQLSANVNLGVTYTCLGELDTALQHTFAALEIAAHEGHTQVEPLVRNNLGLLLLDKGEHEAAESQIETAIALASEVGQLYILPEAHCVLARLAFANRDLAAAQRFAQKALEFARDSGSRIDTGIALRHVGAIAGERGERERAAKCFADALDALAGADTYEYARTLIAEARFLRASDRSGDWRRAGEALEEGRAILEHLGAALDLERLGWERDLR